jgi:hypothetical protein
MRARAPVLSLLAVALLLVPLHPTHATAAQEVDYKAAGFGVVRAFDQLSGHNLGSYAGLVAITVVPTTAFTMVGAIAQDDLPSLTHQREPIAMCIGDPVTCAAMQPKIDPDAIAGSPTTYRPKVTVPIEFHSAWLQSPTGTPWPAGTPVTFFVLATAIDATTTNVPTVGTATEGVLYVSWS